MRRPLFKISCLTHRTDLGVDVVAYSYSASAAVNELTERLTGVSICIRNKSGPEFFGFPKKSVRRELQAEAMRDSDKNVSAEI